MLCQANVALSDWPLGDRRDVDATNPKIQGLLRSGFIVPLVPAGLSRPAALQEEESPAEPAKKPQAKPRARQSARPRAGDE